MANVALYWPRERQTESSAEIILKWKYSATFFAICVLYFQSYADRTLQDADTYWHITTGESIWRTGIFPHIDEYSHTLTGSRWIAKEWLSQLIFYSFYRFGGWFGVSLITSVTASAAYAVLFAWLQRRVKPIVALTMTMVCISFTTGSLLARPQIFFYLLVSLTACGLVGALEGRKTPWWLIPLTALWANMHASFPIAFVLSGLFGGEAIVSAPSEERTRTLAKWTLALLGAVAASGATPYGYEPLWVSVNIVGSSATGYIDEWKPAGWSLVGAYGSAFLVGSLAIVLASGVSRARLLPLVMCGGLMLRHVRFFSLFGFVESASLAGPVAKLFPRFAAQPRAPSARERKGSSLALAIVAVLTVGVVALAPRPRPAANITPERALQAARKAGLTGPVFNDYKFGGYLIFEGVKTFIDGRAELYMGGFFQELATAEVAANPDHFFAMLDRYHVAWALLGKDSGALPSLRRARQWKEIYHDDEALVFVRAAP